jgi:hypothetical protein
MLPVCPLPGTKVLDRFNDEKRIFKIRDSKMDQEYIPYGTGNFVLFKPQNMSAIELQEEILSAYHLFYSFRQIVFSMRRLIQGDVHPFIFRLIGNKLLRSVRLEIKHHIGRLRDNELNCL